MAVETTDVGDVLNGNQYDYQMDSRLGGGGLGSVSCPRDDYLGNPFPSSCYDDRECQRIDPNYVCSTPDSCYVDDKLRSRRNKVCLPIRGKECNLKKSENCEIDGYQGTCTERGYCVPNSCRNDDDCQHDELYFCMRTTNDVKNGRKGKCYLRSEM